MIFNQTQQDIAKEIDNVTERSQWKDWKWQMKHSIKDVDTFEKLTGIKFSDEKRKKIEETIGEFPLSITPYYLSLIKVDDYENDPIYKQSFPDPKELIVSRYDITDPLAEDKDSPVPGLTHRYPDRVLFLVSNTCSMYCRHCTRKRKVGDIDSIPSKKELSAAIQYIRDTPQVRDVLLSGGDPLMLSDEYLEWILTEVSSIPHVEIIRIGTRVPVVLPYRITDNLVNMLKKFKPLYVNTQFNHPREMTASAKKALDMLADAGIPLGNQSVLLAGINDCPQIIKKLCHKLVQNRVFPYYLYQCDLSKGLSHFRTPVGKGIEIIESMIGHTTGFTVPTYVIDAPGGGGKIPVMPNYLISWSTNKVVLRNYEGVITSYKEPDSYEPIFCDRNCDDCKLQLDLEESDESPSVGIEKLLNNEEKEISLIPADNPRITRRDD
ncbi:MAG: lysine 2,3-aminomutase [Candidatus Altiarchaeota archaeon]|nr:lysine 2,3-aminomutase [Candidatus Altiarchaeota archaeon]